MLSWQTRGTFAVAHIQHGGSSANSLTYEGAIVARQPDIPKPTAAELDLLQVLWPLGAATAKQVHQEMQKQRPDVTYATVLRLMQIMHGKGLLIRDESERSHVYAPAQPRDSMQTNLLKDLMQRAFSGSAKALVLAALKSGISKKERDEIEKLLQEDKQ
jgi:predicted transcriptional regulator